MQTHRVLHLTLVASLSALVLRNSCHPHRMYLWTAASFRRHHLPHLRSSLSLKKRVRLVEAPMANVSCGLEHQLPRA